MTFLKRLGQVLAQIGSVVVGLEPIITHILPNNAGTIQTVSQDLTQLANIVVNIEQIGAVLGTPGPEKLKMAAALASQVILQSAVVAKHDILNPALFQQAVNEYAQATVDLLNSLKPDNIQVTSKT